MQILGIPNNLNFIYKKWKCLNIRSFNRCFVTISDVSSISNRLRTAKRGINCPVKWNVNSSHQHTYANCVLGYSQGDVLLFYWNKMFHQAPFCLLEHLDNGYQ
jgi:hypothetical protein